MKDNKLNPFVRIRGNTQRGAEVIAELERRGGTNLFDNDGKNPNRWYFIASDGVICMTGEIKEMACDSFFLANYEEIKLPRWRAKKREGYWYIDMSEGDARPDHMSDYYNDVDDKFWEEHNYFSSKKEAQEKADAINEILRGDNDL